MILAPSIWLHKVDDAFAITHHDKNDMLANLTKINGNIKLTIEEDVNNTMHSLIV